MSLARECDVCGKVHKREPGVLTLDVHAPRADRFDAGWSDVDLCQKCSLKVLAIIKPALLDFDKAIKEKS